MRLVCPNCEAKYEVPEDAIPETGRDVQCANCGHAWYQMRPRAGGAEAAAAPAPVPEPVVEVAAVPPAPAPVEDLPVVPEPVEAEVVEAAPAVVEPEPEAAPEPAPVMASADTDALADPVEEALPSSTEPVIDEAVAETAVPEVAEVEAASPEPAASEPVADEAADPVPAAEEVVASATEAPVAEAVISDAAVVTEEISAEDDSPAADAAAPAAAAYAVDDSVLAILREEAEREAKARRAEGARPLETQTDLGIDAARPAAKKPLEVIPAAPVEADIDDKLAARRARLPDVEEINSTLQPSEAAQDGTGSADAMPQDAEGSSSFRSGFLLVMTVAILGSAVYASADAISELVPALAGPLKAYVSFIDSLRLQLDGLMQSATVAINGN